jgi:hypothetical protein
VGSFLSTGVIATGDSHHLFGTGSVPCVHQVAERGNNQRPATNEVCGVAQVLFTFPASTRLHARLREHRARRPEFAGAFTWPASAPVYDHLAVTELGDLMFRSFSIDSAVMRRIGTDEDLLVVPTDGFRGCTVGGCLWARPTMEGADVTILTAATLRALVEARAASR